MANLFTITTSLQSTLNEIEELEGELTPELEETLLIKQEELEDKVKQYYSIIQLKKSYSELMKDEAARLIKKSKSSERLVERLKSNVKIAVENFGYVPTKAKSKQLVYDDLKAMLISKPKVIYDVFSESSDVDLAIDLINRVSSDDREDTNVINELTTREHIVNVASTITITTKLSIKQAALLQRLVGEEIPIEFGVSISKDGLKTGLESLQRTSYKEEDSLKQQTYLVAIDKDNTYLTFK